MMQYLFVLIAGLQVQASFSNQVGTDMQFESSDTLASAGAAADSTSASLMRKEQDSTQEDGSEQHSDQDLGPGRRGHNLQDRNAVVVAAHGSMIAEKRPKLDGKLDAVPIGAHPASSLAALKRKRWEPCKDAEDSCVFNLVVSSSKFSNWHLQAR